MNRDEFEAKLSKRYGTGVQVAGSVSRLIEVLKSPVFVLMSMAFEHQRLPLMEHIETKSRLVGDPSNWALETDLVDATMKLFDGVSSENLAYLRLPLLYQLSSQEWRMRIRLLISLNYSVSVGQGFEQMSKTSTVRIYVRKSQNYSRSPHLCFEWKVTPVDETRSTVVLNTLSASVNTKLSYHLLTCLQKFVAMDDLFDYRTRKRAELIRNEEERRLAEQKRSEERRIAAESARQLQEQRRIAAERAQQSLSVKITRLGQNRCLDCGAHCVQRRRRRDGHLFLGCSNHFTNGCRGARAIKCPICNVEMVEKKRTGGGTFLGCVQWPACSGFRPVDARLKSDRGVGTKWSSSRYNHSRRDFNSALRHSESMDDHPGSPFDEDWWDEWGDAIQSDDPRESPFYYDHGLRQAFVEFHQEAVEDDE